MHAQVYSAPCLHATFTFRLQAIYLSSSQVWQKLSNLCQPRLFTHDSKGRKGTKLCPTEINYEKCQMHHRVVFFLLSLNNCAESSGLMWKAFQIWLLLITTPHRNWLACSLWLLRCWIFALLFFSFKGAGLSVKTSVMSSQLKKTGTCFFLPGGRCWLYKGCINITNNFTSIILSPVLQTCSWTSSVNECQFNLYTTPFKNEIRFKGGQLL